MLEPFNVSPFSVFLFNLGFLIFGFVCLFVHCVFTFHFYFSNVLFLGATVLLYVQSHGRSALESAKTGISSQFGRSSFGLGPEFTQV
jgi:hypothetical protein